MLSLRHLTKSADSSRINVETLIRRNTHAARVCEGTRSRWQESSSLLSYVWSDVDHRLKQRFSKYRGDEIVEKQEQMRPHADRASALAVERNDRFGRDLPGVCHICQSGIHRGGGFLSARRIERELDERDELMQRLIFGKFARRKAAGEVVGAVLDRESPVHGVNMAGRHRTELARLRIDTKVCRRFRHRVFECHCAGNGEGSQPGEAVRKITEPLAEENAGLERVRIARANALSAGSPDAPSQTGRDHHLVQLVLVEQAFQSESGRVESRALRRPPVAMNPTTLDTNRERGG